MAIAPVSTRPIGAFHTMPGYVGGKTFSSIEAFTKALSSGRAVMRPGDKVSIKAPIIPGAAVPQLKGLNKNSPFSVTYADGKLTIAAKNGAKFGATDKVGLVQKPLVAPGHEPKG